jgi:hypothetical protein
MMKNTALLKSTAFAFMASLSFSALATPVYNGATDANFGTNPGAASSNDAGYYIWSSNSGNDWSVRWTGNDNGSTGWYDWFGTINLQNLEDGSVQGIQFEANHSDQASGSTNILGSAMDLITFEGFAGPAYDGFDFSLTSPMASQVIDFSLGTTLVNELRVTSSDVQGQNIFIGSNFSTPIIQVQVDDPTAPANEQRLVQRFEVSQVPEPSTLALLGLGLLSLVGLRRKAKSA